MNMKIASTITKAITGRRTERRSSEDIVVSLLVVRRWSTSTMQVVHQIVASGAVNWDTVLV
jgi:hypothetical protein